MKAHIYEDELYPYYGILEDWKQEELYEIPDTLVERYRAVELEFRAVQKELRELFRDEF